MTAAALPRACSACGTPLPGGGRFCPQCGRAASSGTHPTARTPWLVAGISLAALLGGVLVMLVNRAPAAAPPPAEAMAQGTPPDISAMTPRDRFNRLYNKVMSAAQTGDEATVTQFTPMALMAYSQLDSFDADARYHAALLDVHTGNTPGALALADSILAETPTHLFGFIIRGTVARFGKDDRTLAAAYAGFLRNYDRELKAARPEYQEHSRAVDEFHQAALAAGKAGS